MKIDINIDNLLSDLEYFIPDTLSSIVNFVRSHNEYNSISMIARNLDRVAMYLLDRCLDIIDENDSRFDVRLAGLLVIVADLDSDLYKELVSSTLNGVSNYNWSRAMSASYLIHKEVLGETICKSA